MQKDSKSSYPFVKCLNPQVIRNKYTHEEMIVSCGKCEACLNRKSSISTMKVRLESQSHKYAKFVTLTYSDDYVPRMSLKKCFCIQDMHGNIHELNHPYVYFENKPRLDGKEHHAVIDCADLESYKILCEKVENKDLPYLCKRDLQLFIKRLRKYLYIKGKTINYDFGKIRYYACGEYGPVHFRPHYHLILWTSDEQTRKILPQAVRACWKFGRVSTETPRDDVSKYVAKYLNGNSYLPEILKSRQIKPFSLHSSHLGESLFLSAKEEVYELPTEEVVKRSSFINGINTDVYMWRSLKTFYFPRCKAYDLRTSQQRLYAYTLETEALQRYGDLNLSDLSRKILAELHEQTKYAPLLTGQWHADPDINDFLKYFIDSCSIDPYQFWNSAYYEKCLRSVYMELRVSNHFIRLCDDGNYYESCRKLLAKIEKFYSDCDYLNLRGQYQDLEEFASDWFDNEEDINLVYSLLPYEISKTNVYTRFKARTINKFRDSVKHKKQNDLNRIFEKLK